MQPIKTLAGAVLFATFVAGSGAQSPPADRARTSPDSMPARNSSGRAGTDRMNSSDSRWLTKAAQGGMAEVALGQLAQSNASSPDVKQFGERMVNDHSKANEELTRLASEKGITLPSGLDARSQATKDRLSKLKGAAFDRAYMADMVNDHRADVSEFQKEANSGQDADLKAFAAKTLPTLQEHLRMAESVHTGVKK